MIEKLDRLRSTMAVNVLRFGAWISIFMIPGDFENISISRILHFAQSAGLLNACTDGLHERSKTGEMRGALQCPLVCLLLWFGTDFWN